GDADRPGRRVLAEQRALRAAQHFHAIDIEQVEHRLARSAIIDIINIDTDAVFQAIVGRADAGAQTTDVDVRISGIAPQYLQAWDQLLDLIETAGACLLQRLAAHDADGDRHILDVLRTPARRHQYLRPVLRACIR